ncbi:MAG TPA: four helix bundle protein [Chitinophagaceae bacterium]|nr:four helix bundle protein [Chitinophagaceae bacterium]
MKFENIEKNLVLKLAFDFSLEIIKFCELLEKQKKFVIARQLLKSGTAIGANIIEAQNAESKADFIHKFKIAAKEADETQYWLLLCQQSEGYLDCISLLSQIDTITRVIGKIILTSRLKSH